MRNSRFLNFVCVFQRFAIAGFPNSQRIQGLWFSSRPISWNLGDVWVYACLCMMTCQFRDVSILYCRYLQIGVLHPVAFYGRPDDVRRIQTLAHYWWRQWYSFDSWSPLNSWFGLSFVWFCQEGALLGMSKWCASPLISSVSTNGTSSEWLDEEFCIRSKHFESFWIIFTLWSLQHLANVLWHFDILCLTLPHSVCCLNRITPPLQTLWTVHNFWAEALVVLVLQAIFASLLWSLRLWYDLWYSHAISYYMILYDDTVWYYLIRSHPCGYHKALMLECLTTFISTLQTLDTKHRKATKEPSRVEESAHVATLPRCGRTCCA